MSQVESELLVQWRKHRDPQAFSRLVTMYGGLVYGTCRRILRTDADAEDATQECFLKLAERTPEVRSSLGAWLHTVATRHSLMKVREQTRRRDRERRYSDSTPNHVESEWNDVEEMVDEAIHALPEDLRSVVVASFLERKTHDEIATELGVARSTVTTRVKRAVDNIRKHLQSRGLVVSAAALSAGLESNMTVAIPRHVAGAAAKIGFTGGPTEWPNDVSLAGSIKRGATSAPKVVLGVTTAAVAAVAWFALTYNQATAPLSSTNPPEKTLLDDADSGVSATGNIDGTDGAAAAKEKLEDAPEPVSNQTSDTEPVNAVAGGPHGRIEGVVYDVGTNQGIAEVNVFASPINDGSGVGGSATTDSGGYYTIDGLAAGEYFVSPGPMPDYPETTLDGTGVDAQIVHDDDIAAKTDIGLNRGGVLTGKVVVNGHPLVNDRISIMSVRSRPNEPVVAPFDLAAIETDGAGRFRIEGLFEFDGNLVGKRARENGGSQDSLLARTVVKYNETTDVTFDFIGGTASVAGRVYYGDPAYPAPSRLIAIFTWHQEGADYNEEIVRTETESDGTFHIANLPAGNLELHVRPLDRAGMEDRVVNIALSAGRHVEQDVVFSQTRIDCRIANIPSTTHVLFLMALPEDIDLNVTDAQGLVAVRDAMLAVTRLYPAGRSVTGTLDGLEPGVYTIAAASWPTDYNLAQIRDYGVEKFYEDLKAVYSIVEVKTTDTNLSVELEFQ